MNIYNKAMSFIYKRFLLVRNDSLLAASLLVAMAELVCHLFEIKVSGFQMGEVIRAFFCAVYLVVGIFVCKRDNIYILFSALALALLYFNKYTNYTSWFIIVLTIQKKQKYRNPLLILYGMDVLVCLFIGHRLAHQAFIHLLNCLFIYLVVNLDFNRQKGISLTVDERRILDEWIQVGEMKAISCFAKNTVFRKMKEARERNGLQDNEELLARYQETKLVNKKE